jgi:hypothetical protein
MTISVGFPRCSQHCRQWWGWFLACSGTSNLRPKVVRWRGAEQSLRTCAGSTSCRNGLRRGSVHPLAGRPWVGIAAGGLPQGGVGIRSTAREGTQGGRHDSSRPDSKRWTLKPRNGSASSARQRWILRNVCLKRWDDSLFCATLPQLAHPIPLHPSPLVDSDAL